jgi:uncharacterized protein with PIN domain
MKNTNKMIAAIFIFTLLFSITSFTQEKQDSSDTNMKTHKMGMKKDHKTTNSDSSIVRMGVIDLKTIDKNKDGKVYQDMMDYNVISDKAGKCPLCGMKLKEVSLEKAKENLINSGYKVK